MSEDRVGDELAHARLGPSGADGWMICAGKPAAEEGLPDGLTEFSAEGSVGHDVSDQCLSSPVGFEPDDFVGQVSKIKGTDDKGQPVEFDIEFDEDMAEALQPGIEWVRAQPGIFFGERRVDLSRWLGPKQFGTLDRGIIAPKLLIINDLKFGRGIPVSPVRNRQLMLYGLGFWDNIARHISDAKDFLFVIDQPRHAGGGGEWRCTLDELLAFGEEARIAAQKTLDPFADRTASEKGCFWCKRRKAPGGCETFDAYNLDVLGVKFNDLDDPDKSLEMQSGLTPERRSYVIRHAKMIEGWLETLHEQTLIDALAGNPTPTLKAVEGRKTPDKWGDKVKAEGLVPTLIPPDKAFTKKLITPKQASTLISPEDVSTLETCIVRGSKKPILVPEADARLAITPLDAKFEDEN